MGKGLPRFRDISILKKMFLILAVTFLIPLIVAGLILVWYIGARDAEYETRQDLIVLESIARELGGTLRSAEEIAELVIARGLVWKFAKGMVSYRDFVSLTDLSDDLLRNLPLIKSIILFRENRVVFERGPALDSDIPAYPEDLEEAVRAGGSPYWTPPRKMNYFSGNISPLMIPLYRTLNRAPGEEPLVLFVGLSVEELAARYRAFTRGRLFFLNSRGLVLSSSGEEGGPDLFPPGTLYPPELYGRFQGDRGFIREPGGSMVLYVKGYRDWYLVNSVSDYRQRFRQGGLYVIVLLAALLGICFTGAALIMQRRYIFNPLKTMLEEMNQFREGNLAARMSYRAGDEIGRINREVEGIFRRLHDLIHEVYITRIYNQEATLKMLSSQINPHFLYNTLDSIRWKAIRNKDPEVGEQIEALSDLFRHILSRGDDLVTVDQEIRHLETYLFIMNFRYRDRISCKVHIAEGVRNIPIPKLILQPIVENAIIHGIEKQAGPGEIDVGIEKKDGLLAIRVTDNGRGIDPEEIRRTLKGGDDSRGGEGGLALKNIDRRIKLCYGEEYGLEFSGEPGKGTVVRLSIPLKVKERESETPHTG
jgi:two-component system sensor histidine kinase YesM